ncbi:hypothetical protein PR048_013531 [Dryococelus australis]|uniref:DUF4371 domain-containing protein n=1 Tax=Dryococelus australis TaxID=614101 RepID=A0ABQ9HT96_9NEOP|nr:hypothetical protein PR048_013531 [Dryococelus australis]
MLQTAHSCYTKYAVLILPTSFQHLIHGSGCHIVKWKMGLFINFVFYLVCMVVGYGINHWVNLLRRSLITGKMLLKNLTYTKILNTTKFAFFLQVNFKISPVKNKMQIILIIQTVLLCGCQGIALRAHSGYDPINLDEDPNAMYTSPQIQIGIIEACNDIILNTLVKKGNSAKCFAIHADKTTDISGIEQLYFYVLYEKLGKISSNLCLLPMSVAKVSRYNFRSIKNVGLDATFLQGQSYDGTASMCGQFNGVQAHVPSVHPLVVYLHCSSHSLNLAVKNACYVQAIQNCKGIVGIISKFFKYPKQLNVLKESVERKVPNANATRLKSLCPTRWI